MQTDIKTTHQGEDKSLAAEQARAIEHALYLSKLNPDWTAGFLQAFQDKNTAKLDFYKFAAGDIVESIPEHPAPVVLIHVNGGTVESVDSNQSVRVAILDKDTEGADVDRISMVDGDEVYVSYFSLTSERNKDLSVVDPEYVDDVLKQLDWLQETVSSKPRI